MMYEKRTDHVNAMTKEEPAYIEYGIVISIFRGRKTDEIENGCFISKLD